MKGYRADYEDYLPLGPSEASSVRAEADGYLKIARTFRDDKANFKAYMDSLTNDMLGLSVSHEVGEKSNLDNRSRVLAAEAIEVTPLNAELRNGSVESLKKLKIIRESMASSIPSHYGNRSSDEGFEKGAYNTDQQGDYDEDSTQWHRQRRSNNLAPMESRSAPILKKSFDLENKPENIQQDLPHISQASHDYKRSEMNVSFAGSSGISTADTNYLQQLIPEAEGYEAMPIRSDYGDGRGSSASMPAIFAVSPRPSESVLSSRSAASGAAAAPKALSAITDERTPIISNPSLEYATGKLLQTDGNFNSSDTVNHTVTAAPFLEAPTATISYDAITGNTERRYNELVASTSRIETAKNLIPSASFTSAPATETLPPPAPAPAAPNHKDNGAKDDSSLAPSTRIRSAITTSPMRKSSEELNLAGLSLEKLKELTGHY